MGLRELLKSGAFYFQRITMQNKAKRIAPQVDVFLGVNHPPVSVRPRFEYESLLQDALAKVPQSSSLANIILAKILEKELANNKEVDAYAFVVPTIPHTVFIDPQSCYKIFTGKIKTRTIDQLLAHEITHDRVKEHRSQDPRYRACNPHKGSFQIIEEGFAEFVTERVVGFYPKSDVRVWSEMCDERDELETRKASEKTVDESYLDRLKEYMSKLRSESPAQGARAQGYHFFMKIAAAFGDKHAISLGLNPLRDDVPGDLGSIGISMFDWQKKLYKVNRDELENHEKYIERITK